MTEKIQNSSLSGAFAAPVPENFGFILSTPEEMSGPLHCTQYRLFYPTEKQLTVRTGSFFVDVVQVYLREEKCFKEPVTTFKEPAKFWLSSFMVNENNHRALDALLNSVRELKNHLQELQRSKTVQTLLSEHSEEEIRSIFIQEKLTDISYLKIPTIVGKEKLTLRAFINLYVFLQKAQKEVTGNFPNFDMYWECLSFREAVYQKFIALSRHFNFNANRVEMDFSQLQNNRFEVGRLVKSYLSGTYDPKPEVTPDPVKPKTVRNVVHKPAVKKPTVKKA